jgi:hypothetical protein
MELSWEAKGAEDLVALVREAGEGGFQDLNHKGDTSKVGLKTMVSGP